MLACVLFARNGMRRGLGGRRGWEGPGNSIVLRRTSRPCPPSANPSGVREGTVAVERGPRDPEGLADVIDGEFLVPMHLVGHRDARTVDFHFRSAADPTSASSGQQPRLSPLPDEVT